jgi:hypothetical protein
VLLFGWGPQFLWIESIPHACPRCGAASGHVGVAYRRFAILWVLGAAWRVRYSDRCAACAHEQTINPATAKSLMAWSGVPFYVRWGLLTFVILALPEILLDPKLKYWWVPYVAFAVVGLIARKLRYRPVS